MKKSILILLAAFGMIPCGLWAQGDDNWFMAQTVRANLISVSSTAELVETQFGGDYLYPPANVLDGKGATTWCPGGRGLDQALTIGLSEAVSFDEIQIVNGFAGQNDLYLKNNRVKTIQLTQVAGKHFQNKEYTLADKQPAWQSIKFPLPQTAKTISFAIKDVYRGYKYDDTCLSDIRLLYRGKVIPFVGADTLIKLQTEQSKALLGANSEKDFQQNYVGCLLLNDDRECFIFHARQGDGETGVSFGYYDPSAGRLTRTNYSSYAINKNRIITQQTIGYVKTKVSLIFVPDAGNGVTINGVYYRRLDLPQNLRIVSEYDER